MNRLFPPVTLLAFCLCTGATAQTAAKTSATPSPKTAPAVVTPAPGDVLIPAPSDAQVLFDGKDLAQWCRKDGSPAAWTVENGDMVVKAKSGNIQTKRNFGDCSSISNGVRPKTYRTPANCAATAEFSAKPL